MWKEFCHTSGFIQVSQKNHNFQKDFKIFKDVERILLYRRKWIIHHTQYRMSILKFLKMWKEFCHTSENGTHIAQVQNE